MGKILKPLIRGGGFYPTNKLTPLIYNGGFTTEDGGKEPPDPLNTFTGKIVQFLASAVKPIVNLTATLSPSQDLHGYDAPWPAGGGVNKLDISTCTAQTAYGLVGSIGTDGFVHMDGEVTSTNASLQFNTVTVSNKQKTEIAGKGYVISITDVSGGTITASWGLRTSSEASIAIALNNPGLGETVHLKFRIVVATTAQSTWTPYSNICPISGHQGVTAKRAGANLFNTTDYTVVGGYYIDASGVVQANQYMKYCATYIKVNASEQYAIGCKKTTTDSASISAAYYDKNKAFISRDLVVSPTASATTVSGTFTTPANTAYIRFNWPASSNETQIVKGNAILSPYEPYTGTTYPITFPDSAGTVYGGTLEVNEDGSGTLTVDRAYTDLSEDWAWIRSSRYPGGYFCDIGNNVPLMKTQTPFICTHAKTVTTTSAYIMGTCYCDGSINFRIMSETSTVADWKNYIVAQKNNGTEIGICYELANPIAYTLTAEQVGQITTLKGTNTIWVDDSDEISVTAYGTEVE